MFDTDFSNGSHDHYKGLIPFLSSLTTEKRLRNFYKKRKNFENSFWVRKSLYLLVLLKICEIKKKLPKRNKIVFIML